MTSNLESRPQHYFSLCGYFFQDTISLYFFRKIAFLLPRPIAGKCAPPSRILQSCVMILITRKDWLLTLLQSSIPKDGALINTTWTRCHHLVQSREARGWGHIVQTWPRWQYCCIGKGGQLGFNHWDLGQYNKMVYSWWMRQGPSSHTLNDIEASKKQIAKKVVFLYADMLRSSHGLSALT